LPALILYAVAVFLPIGASLALSLFSWDGISAPQFVGVANYVQMLQEDPIFWTAFRNSVVYTAINLLIQLGMGLFLANLLTYVGRGRELIKTLYFLPTVISTVAIAFLFRKIYSFEPAGLVNLVLSQVGLGGLATPWLSDLGTALAAVSIPDGWRMMGVYMVILYAGLLAVPQELQEAARIDGASEWRVFWSIRFPYIRPVWYTTMVMATTFSLRGFDIPYLLTNGGPGQSTELLTTYMYRTGFTQLEFGYGSAIAVFIVLQCMAVVALILGFRRVSGG
jgi:raffinose/stachyose/melibiose transport system permease protein